MANRRLLLATILVCVLASLAYVWSINPSQKQLPTRIAVTIGTPLVSPVMLLDDSSSANRPPKFTIQNYLTGKTCFDALISGGADVATVAETPLVHAAGRGVQFEVLATLSSSSDHVHVVARKDHGVVGVHDLVGKNIGVPVGTNNEFYLHEFLVHNGIEKESVRVVNFDPAELSNSLVAGVIDAAVIWNPYLAEIEERIPDDIVVFPSGEYYTVYYFLVAQRGYAASHSESVQDLLSAIKTAQSIDRSQFSRLADRLHIKLSLLTQILPSYAFPPTTDQSHLKACLRQVSWSAKGDTVREALASKNLNEAFSFALGNKP